MICLLNSMLRKWQSVQAGMTSREVQVFMPRLKVENKFKLRQTLTDMGMPVAFTEMAEFFRYQRYAGHDFGCDS